MGYNIRISMIGIGKDKGNKFNSNFESNVLSFDEIKELIDKFKKVVKD